MIKLYSDKIFDGFEFTDDKVLVLENDGTVTDLVPRASAGSDLKIVNGIITPGFVNCHCHLELSHMKGMIPRKSGLVKFVTDVVQQRHLPENEILEAIQLAEDEMLNNGIVAVGDICNNSLTIPQKSKGRIHYHNFIEASGFIPAIAPERFQRAVGFFKEYAELYPVPIESVSIVPHAPYSVSEELWDLLLQFPGNHLFTIHNQETFEENEWFVDKSGGLSDLYKNLNIDVGFFQPPGLSSIQSFLSRFLKNQSVILVHNVHTSEEDLSYARIKAIDAKLYWCFCVNANQYITGDLPDLDLFRKYNCDIVLGTDSLASNDQLSIAAELKTIRKNFPNLPLEELLKWATSNGATALNLDKLTGSFESGKKPGVLLIDESLENVLRLY